MVNYLLQKALAKFCTPSSVVLLRLALQKANQANSTYAAFWQMNHNNKSIDAKIKKEGAVFQAHSDGQGT